MDKKSRMSRRKQKAELKDFVNMITAVALIVIAALLLVFVYFYIKNNGLFGGLFSGEDETTSAAADIGESESSDPSGRGPVPERESLNEGLNYLESGELIYVLSDREKQKFDQDSQISYEGTTVLRSSWYGDGENLFYFGEDGAAVKERAERAMRCAFDDNYKLDKISFDKNYRGDGADEGTYPAAVRTKTLMAFIDETKTFDGYYTVMYKKTTDSLSHELGGGSNPQYTSKYTLSIADGYIYYLALADDGTGNAAAETIENRLYRMKPGADYREIVAEDALGYIVYEDPDGDVSVYYDDGYRVRKAVNIQRDENTPIFSENADYYVDISDGRAILMMEGGYPVTQRNDAFKAGNFVYTLSAEGEILDVQGKTDVSTGGYVYLVQSGEAFGVNKSRVLRRDSTGAYEVISAEFNGTVGDLHFDFDSNSIIAEYFDNMGNAGLIKISLDGDVDCLEDSLDIGGGVSLLSIQDGMAVIQTEDDEEPFTEVRIAASYPLAAGIDPYPLDENGQGEPQETEPQTEEYDASVEGESVPQISGGPGGTETKPEGPGGPVIGNGPGPGPGTSPESGTAGSYGTYPGSGPGGN